MIKGGPWPRYLQLIQDGKIRKDPHQATTIQKLQHLHERIAHYNPQTVIDAQQPATFSKVKKLTVNLIRGYF